MRKLLIGLMLLSLLLVGLIPAFAQDGTVADVVVAAASDEENPEFTILLAAVQAADPGILGTLSNPDNQVTVFAPTDAAFATLLEELDMDADTLLADSELLNSVLRYHVLEGAVMAETVVTLDGQSVETILADNNVRISVTEDGVMVNDSNVVTTDIAASNGVIHVIDRVLIPGGDMMMDDDEMMDDEMMADSVHIRVAHFSPDTPAVDVYVNGELSAVQGLEFPSITDWIELEAGTYNVAVAPAGTSIDDAAIGPADFDLPEGAWITVAAIGSLSDGTLAPAVIVEDFSAIEEGNARVGVFHAIEGAPAVDVLAGGDAVITELGFPGTFGDNDGFFVLDVPADTYDFQVTATGDAETVVLDLPGTELAANTVYFVAAVGTLDNPQVALASTSMDMMGDDMMDDDMMSNTIADIVVASAGDESNPQFGTLLAAVQAADPGILEALSNPDVQLTVFAPTDDAFVALLADLNMDAESLLAQTDLLNSVLLYHVVEGAVNAETVVTLSSAATLNGEEITIEVNDDGVFLNGTIQVITTDIQADNGIIHVIDGVLLPPTTE